MPYGWIFAYIIGNICMFAVAFVTQVNDPWPVGFLYDNIFCVFINQTVLYLLFSLSLSILTTYLLTIFTLNFEQTILLPVDRPKNSRMSSKHSVASDLSLHCKSLLRPLCLNTKGKYSIWEYSRL